MFEITPDDIALLSDEQLRAVVARLCETALRERGISPAHVTWGGNQNAPDGGIDVRVALPNGTTTSGYIPRPATGFQVKQQDMPAGEIKDEMRPKGVIRPSIQDLAKLQGAYVIVSGQGSTSDTALNNRRDAMRDAVAGIPKADQLILDFYDRTRMATWVRNHEGLIPWVRTLIGKSIPGWQSYGAWAYPHEGVTAEYFVDEQLRIQAPKKTDEKGFSARQGIQAIRQELQQVQHVVRLVGLSGLGKTRLVQALFDDRIGTDSINPALAIYTNMADDPEPLPVVLATDLVANSTRVVLVIDNCPADLHQRLSDVCRQPQSQLSVLTIEYDIREDTPEGTQVFTLEPASTDLIEKIIGRRFPAVSEIDAHSIADFSGGNARIAIALAATIEHHETIAGLTDDQLFQRLFHQRHAQDDDLYLAGQVCSLVYSFQGEDVSNNQDGELARLGSLLGRTPQELYRRVAELQRRDLVQARGVWRAVLPHAIANRLASVALQNIPYSAISDHVLSSERLLRSFSRRLGYLHKSKEAVKIVKAWLATDGFLGDIAKLDDLGKTIVTNIAPTAPEEVLAALERALEGPDKENATTDCKAYLDVLRSIAYDPALFNRCVTLMAEVIVGRESDERSHGTRLFVSLFSLCLSGTHATIQDRLNVVQALVGSASAKRRALGVLALKAALEAWQFMGAASFEFGARSRDYGYWPRNDEEAQHWFRSTLALVQSLACSDAPVGPDARQALAEQFRGLWHRGGVPQELAVVCQAIRERGFWPGGWLAVRQTLEYDAKGMLPKYLSALNAIEAQLRPTDVVEKVRAIVFSNQTQGLDFEDFEEHPDEDIGARVARTEALARDLGRTVATGDGLLDALLREIVSTDGRLWEFGEGLADGATDPEELWGHLVAGFAATNEAARRPQVFRGFLKTLQTKNSALASALLDRALEDVVLAAWYPCLAVAIGIDSAGVARLKRALTLGKAPAGMYTYLAMGRATDPIPAPDLRDILVAIAKMSNGLFAAAEVLRMRLYSHKGQNVTVAPELSDAGCTLLKEYDFASKDDRADHRLGEVAVSCLSGDGGAAVVADVCRKLKLAVTTYKTHAFYHDDVLEGLFRAQPLAALDALCGGNTEELDQGIRILRDVRARKYVLGFVPEDEILRWCDQEPGARYPAIASVMLSARRPSEKEPLQWTNLALQFLKKAPDPGAVLLGFVSQFAPGGWTGSLVGILESHAKLFDDLAVYPQLAGAVAQARARLEAETAFHRRLEDRMERARDERFE